MCLTQALSLAPASIVTPVDFLRLPLIAVVGMVFYGEGLDAYVFVGAAIIFGANYMNIIVESRQKLSNRT
jgi:drug/metabolite transporter (DMT)-like permease